MFVASHLSILTNSSYPDFRCVTAKLLFEVRPQMHCYPSGLEGQQGVISMSSRLPRFHARKNENFHMSVLAFPLPANSGARSVWTVFARAHAASRCIAVSRAKPNSATRCTDRAIGSRPV